MDSMTLAEIMQVLRALTKERRAGVDDQMMSFLRTSLTPDGPQKITQAELHQREEALEARLGEWWLTWDEANQSYGIIPREE
jgi:hypothetical protein